MDLRTIAIALAVIAGMLAYNHWIENPGVAELATEQAEHACTVRTAQAAEEARKATEAQVSAAGEEALEMFRKASAARQDRDRRVQAQLEEDIADYEQKLDAAGRSCRLDRSDFEWLRN